MSFPHLHLHTKYSILDGSIRPNKLSTKLKRMAADSDYMDKNNLSIAMTDHGNLFGAVDFYKQMKQNEIKPIIGYEAYSAYDNDRFNTDYNNENHQNYHFVLLAKNHQGYKNLIKIASKAAQEGFYYNPRIDTKLVNKYSDGLIGLSGCLGGRIATHINNDQKNKAKKWIKKWKNILGNEDFYLEIQYHGQPEDKKVTKGLIELSDETDTKLVTTQDSHFLNQGEDKYVNHMLAIKDNVDPEEDMGFVMNSDLWLKRPEDIINKFPDEFKKYAEKGIENASEIGKKCNDPKINLDTVYMPKYPILNKDNSDNSKEKIWKLIMSGIKEKYNGPDTEIMKRIKQEMEVIENKGYVDYFLIVWDFVQWCQHGVIDDPNDIRYGVGLDKNGNKITELEGGNIRPGPGRGSAAGSVVSYVLGIINKVDPLEHNLLFERFLNPERSELPDIDMDFPRQKLKDLRKYVELKYGEEYVAPLGTFGTLGSRSAIREIGRIKGKSRKKIDKLSEKIPEDPKFKFSVKEALGRGGRKVHQKELKKMYDNSREYEEWLDLAAGVEGMLRNKGVHAGGILISPKKINEYIPLWKDGTTQYDMYSAEDVGAVKFDFLGLNNIDIIEKATEKIEKFHGKELDPINIPLEDKDAYELIGEGRVRGLFQINNDGCAELAKKMKPTKFEHIAALIALYRPGPLKANYDEKFVARMHGEEEIEYPHQDIEDILSETYGLMIYQEQVMKICQRMAGYTLAEADKMRKAIGKKIESLMNKQKEKFIKGCIDNGYDKDLAKSIWDDIEGFADYGFNKSHAASYGSITAETAYMKAHYPACFAAGALTATNSQDSRSRLIREFKKSGWEIKLPDINESGAEFEVIDDNTISHGIESVKSVKDDAAKEIEQEREKNGKYKDISDFCTRVTKVDKSTIRALGKVGAFRSIGLSSSDVVNNLEEINNKAKSSDMDTGEQQALFSNNELKVSVDINKTKKATNTQKIKWQVDLLGFAEYKKLIQGNINDKINNLTEIKMEDVKKCKPGNRIVLIGFIEELWEHVDSNKDTMAFVNASDETDKKRITIFSDQYQEIKNEIDEGQFGIFACMVDEYQGENTLNLIEYNNLEDEISDSLLNKLKPDNSHWINHKNKLNEHLEEYS